MKIRHEKDTIALTAENLVEAGQLSLLYRKAETKDIYLDLEIGATILRLIVTSDAK
jgi:hypothetical protein